MDKRKSTKGKRIYILDRSGNHQKITPNQGVTSGAGTAYPSGAPEFTPGFIGVRFTRSLVLHICFVDRCLSFWSLCCLFFFDLWILINPLVSSNSSYVLCPSSMTCCTRLRPIQIKGRMVYQILSIALWEVVYHAAEKLDI